MSEAAQKFIDDGRLKPRLASEEATKLASNKASQEAIKLVPARGDNLEPLNVRLRAGLLERFRLALAIRKAKKQTPWTQRDVLTEALERWLAEHEEE